MVGWQFVIAPNELPDEMIKGGPEVVSDLTNSRGVVCAQFGFGG